MALKLSNNADGLLATAISNSATSLTLRSGHGSRFPALSSGDWFPITVVRASDPSQLEIMRCTARSGDTLTVVRAQEGTSAIAFNAGDVVSLRLTSGTLEENFPQVEGRNAKNLRFSVDSVGGKPELKFKSGNNEETVVRRSDLGTAATSDVTTSPTDTTSGRVLTVGSLGLGNPITLTSSDDLNDIRSPGTYRHTGGNAPANAPISGAGIVTVFRGSPTGYVVQEWRDRGGQRIFQRAYNNDSGVWTSWIEFYHTGNDESLVKTSRTISTGTGLTGGGNLSANRTISIDPNYDASLVKTSRTISTGPGLAGGGDLSANRTISLATSHIPIGIGQTWQNVTSSRRADTTYTNTTGRSIMVVISVTASGPEPTFTVNDVVVANFTVNTHVHVWAVVPPGSTYRLNAALFSNWAELR